METYREILMESSLILVVFYLGYILFFSRETCFLQNRFYLLAGIILSFILPFVQFPVFSDYQPNVLIQLKAVEIFGSGKQVLASSSFFSIGSALKIIYLGGVLYLFIRFLYHLWIISKFRNQSKIIKNGYGKVIYTGKRHPVFSFLNYVFIDSETENSKELEVILEHERVHIVQLHSIDLLLLEVLAIVQWFNPIVWLYLKSIRQNHEYLADQGVLKNGFSVDAYQYVLLNNYSALGFGFANSFNHSLTFKRLMMMKKFNSNKLSAVKLLLIAPVILITVYFVSCSNKQEVKNDLDGKVVIGQEIDSSATLLPPPPPPPPPPTDKSGLNVVDVMPQFPGGDSELINYLAKNVVYPKEAKERGIQGKVYVQFTISKLGKVENAKVIRSASPLLDDEALRVMNSMPAWKPGTSKGKPVDVNYTIPINFKLQ